MCNILISFWRKRLSAKVTGGGSGGGEREGEEED